MFWPFDFLKGLSYRPDCDADAGSCSLSPFADVSSCAVLLSSRLRKHFFSDEI